MTKTYHDHIKTGDLTQMEAIKLQSDREAARSGMAATLDATAAQGLPADTSAFGALDTIAVRFVQWYGAAAAADVFRHYAEVCGRQDKKPEGGDA